MISRNEEQPISPIRREGPLDATPLGFGAIVLAALDRVSHRNDEIRVISIDLAPRFLVNARDGISGSIA